MVNSIIIENDNMYEAYMPLHDKNPEELTGAEIIEIVEAAGIVGMGGAGFPTNVKLSPKNPDKIDTIIVNGAECEPYLTSDYRRMIEQTDELIKGLNLVLKIFPDAKGCFGFERFYRYPVLPLCLLG